MFDKWRTPTTARGSTGGRRQSLSSESKALREWWASTRATYETTPENSALAEAYRKMKEDIDSHQLFVTPFVSVGLGDDESEWSGPGRFKMSFKSSSGRSGAMVCEVRAVPTVFDGSYDGMYSASERWIRQEYADRFVLMLTADLVSKFKAPKTDNTHIWASALCKNVDSRAKYLLEHDEPVGVRGRIRETIRDRKISSTMSGFYEIRELKTTTRAQISRPGQDPMGIKKYGFDNSDLWAKSGSRCSGLNILPSGHVATVS